MLNKWVVVVGIWRDGHHSQIMSGFQVWSTCYFTFIFDMPFISIIYLPNYEVMVALAVVISKHPKIQLERLQLAKRRGVSQNPNDLFVCMVVVLVDHAQIWHGASDQLVIHFLQGRHYCKPTRLMSLENKLSIYIHWYTTINLKILKLYFKNNLNFN